jgi:hypothetical protein
VNATSSNCPVSSFPTAYPSAISASVDVLQAATTFGGVTVSNVTLAGNQNPYQQVPYAVQISQSIYPTPATVPVTLSYSYSAANPCGSAACKYQIQVSVATDAAPQACLANTYAGTTQSGTVNTTINVPNVPGRYYIGIDRGLSTGGCGASWQSGPPNALRYIAIVDVLPNYGE